MAFDRTLTALGLVSLLAFAACGDDEPANNSANGTTNNMTTADAGGDMEEVDMGPVEEDMGGEVDMGPPPGVERLPVSFSVFPPVPVNCDDPGARQKFPFAYTSNDVFPVVEGDLVNGRVVRPNTTLDIGTFAVRRPRVQILEEAYCDTESDCPSGYKCASAGLPGARRQCTIQTGFEFVPRTVKSEVDNGLGEREQLVTILIENTTSLDGRLPSRVSTLYGEDGMRDFGVNPDRATDPTRVHRDAIKTFSSGLASVADPQNTNLSLWFYAGDVGARTRPLLRLGELQDHYVNDLSAGEPAIDGMTDPLPEPANIYQAINTVVARDLGLEKYDGYEKFLYIFTDGANEVYDEAATAQTVTALLEEKGIKTYIIHLDSEIDPSLLRDLPTVWQGNLACEEDPNCQGAPPCGSDADCKNFETCRPAKIYAEEETGSVTETPLSYCMPDYESGRLGPIDDYADIACRTNGNYIYVAEPELMRQYWRNLQTTVNGLFSVEADLSAYEDEDVQPGFYRVSATILGLLGAGSLEQNFSTPVGTRVGADSRPIVRFGRPGN